MNKHSTAVPLRNLIMLGPATHPEQAKSIDTVCANLNVCRQVVGSFQDCIVRVKGLSQVDIIQIDLDYLKKQEYMDIVSIKYLINYLKNNLRSNKKYIPCFALFSNSCISREEIVEMIDCDIQAFVIQNHHVDWDVLEGMFSALLTGGYYFSHEVYQILRGDINKPPTDMIIYTPNPVPALNRSYLDLIRQEIPLEWHYVNNLGQLFNKLSSITSSDPKILVDLDMIANHGSNVMDMAHSIQTLANASFQQMVDIPKNSVKLYMIVGINTNISVIRQALQTPAVSGIVAISGSEFSLKDLKQGFRDIEEHKYHIPAQIQAKLDANKSLRRSKSATSLTDRQKQILDLIRIDGASNKAIALKLKISESTVKLHLGHILKKYNLRNRTQLVLTLDHTSTTNA